MAAMMAQCSSSSDAAPRHRSRTPRPGWYHDARLRGRVRAADRSPLDGAIDGTAASWVRCLRHDVLIEFPTGAIRPMHTFAFAAASAGELSAAYHGLPIVRPPASKHRH